MDTDDDAWRYARSPLYERKGRGGSLTRVCGFVGSPDTAAVPQPSAATRDGRFASGRPLSATALSVTLALLGPEACIQVSVSVVVEAAA